MKVLGGISRRKQAMYFLAFLGIPLLLLAITFYIPLSLAIKLSFTKYDVLTPAKYVGLKNWERILSDEIFWISLKNSFIYVAIYTFFTTVISFLIAIGLNIGSKYTHSLRTFYFLPMISSSIAIMLVWKWIYNPSYGVLNTILSFFGVPRINWLNSPKTVLLSLAVFSIWSSVTYYALIFLAGLQNIPKVYYEAAAIDGASKFQQIIHVTAPLISPTTFFVLVMTSLAGIQVFDPVFILTQGGPGYASYSVVYYIYKNGFFWFRMGYGVTISCFFAVILFALAVIHFRLQKRWVHYA